MSKPDYYDILQLNKDASQDEIKSRYKKLAKEYHPDKSNGETLEIFKEIQEAYSVLSDPYQRGKYDAAMEGDQPNSGILGPEFYEAMESVNNIFNQPFFNNNGVNVGSNMTGLYGFQGMNGMSFSNNRSNDSKSYSHSYSSTTISSRDSSGNIKTTKKVTVNKNGQNSDVYQEYYVNKDGKKYVTKNIRDGKRLN